MEIRFLLIGEGSSDTALKFPLEDLCLRCGADEASGVAPDLRRYETSSLEVEDKIRSALQLEPEVDVIFVHRDADDEDPRPRLKEVKEAFRSLEPDTPWVPVIPVQSTEAWALVDEGAIRRAAENPNGTVSLEIPSPQEAESITDPKSRLFELLVTASEYSGRHLKKFKSRLHKRRYLLLERLDVRGPLSDIPAWTDLSTRLTDVIREISNSD